jgi:signal transduction histidine kinase
MAQALPEPAASLLLNELPDAARASPQQLEEEIRLAGSSPVVTSLLALSDSVLLVLNSHRQIVAFNPGATSLDGAVLGRRTGEILSCINAGGVHGCGTQPSCRTCGALAAMLEAQHCEHAVENSCSLETSAGTALEFAVGAAPLEVGGYRLLVVSLREISSERRREALEQIFFHDVLNTVTGLRGWADLLARGLEVSESRERVQALANRLEREIRGQRALLDAEAGTLEPHREVVSAAEVVGELLASFSYDAAELGRVLEVEATPEPSWTLLTDAGLLNRVLANMVRNALEATDRGSAVRLFCLKRPAELRFGVANDGVIPRAVALRIFQRSFSTKAARGRGLGTYGMKLLGERYLGGRVAFETTPEAGTRFFIDLPA